jgi:hypothetical protein
VTVNSLMAILPVWVFSTPAPKIGALALTTLTSEWPGERVQSPAQN